MIELKRTKNTPAIVADQSAGVSHRFAYQRQQHVLDGGRPAGRAKLFELSEAVDFKTKGFRLWKTRVSEFGAFWTDQFNLQYDCNTMGESTYEYGRQNSAAFTKD